MWCIFMGKRDNMQHLDQFGKTVKSITPIRKHSYIHSKKKKGKKRIIVSLKNYYKQKKKI